MANDRRRGVNRDTAHAFPRLPFEQTADRADHPDEAARRFATDPRRNVVLEASAGTGKTTVLVSRYLNLLDAGVDPKNILAITFTRKAAAEMRQRIVRELQRRASLSVAGAARWHDLRDRLGDIAISTIDAFCLSLLREFPMEAGLDPGFDIADETLSARIREDALDRTLAVCRRMAVRDESIALLVARLGQSRLRQGLERLLDRRLAARGILRRFAAAAPARAFDVCRAAADRVAGAIADAFGSCARFREDGPRSDPAFPLVASDLELLDTFARAGGPSAATGAAPDVAQVRAALDGVRGYFLTRRGEPRRRPAGRYARADFRSPGAYQRHVRAIGLAAPRVADALAAYDRDLNRLLVRGARRAFEVANWQYGRQLAAHAVLDFSELLARTLGLLARMDEFSQSRYRLESRFHHVLVDEFQDTSRAQWRLVSLLVKSWGEGAGLAGGVLPPSIFVVGDRKQSIYGFRDADATILTRARRDIEALRAEGSVRRSIARSFRSAPALLAFSNDLFASVPLGAGAGRFRFASRDGFPIDDVPAEAPRIGVIAADSVDACAAGVATEVARLLARHTMVRDPRTGTPRPATAGDIAILFRSREGHQAYERALTAGGVPAYVYKGLGFFDADETKDLVAIVEYLARPDSDTAAAALLRSRLVRLSDGGLRRLAPHLAAALAGQRREGEAELDDEDRSVLEQARQAIAAWLPLVDRLPPAEVVDRVLDDAAYSYELRGPRRLQARENVKKMRALMRKIQNAGYATLSDLAGHLRTLSAGDESNAVVDAIDAVNLMTVHAAKGLEFPIVFLVNLSRGTGGRRDPIRVGRECGAVSVSIGDFVSESDDQVPQRETEETKRLLYVAVTRARDLLYFSSPLTEGRFEPRRGSLGSVLPETFAPLVAEQAEGCARIAEWRGPSGRVHRLSVCPHDAPPSAAEGAPGAVQEHVSGPDLFGRLGPGGVPRVAVTALASADGDDAALGWPSAGAPVTAESQVALGLLVHRLFQSLGDATPTRHELRGRARSLLDAADLAVPGQDTRLVERAIETVQAICADSRVDELRRQGKWFHEVPFSMMHGSAVVRGVIDSLVTHPGGVTVVEIKTGGPRPEHAKQLDVYRAAAAALFPGRPVDAVLVYGPRGA